MANVLLVEDDPDQLAMRRFILEACGHRVRPASSLAEALERLSGIDVVVMDLRIPTAQDGLDLISAVDGAARIIVLSGDSSVGPLPVDLFLTKPCSSQVLVDAITRLASA